MIYSTYSCTRLFSRVAILNTVRIFEAPLSRLSSKQLSFRSSIPILLTRIHSPTPNLSRGCNSAKVTIWGESAGAISVGLHMVLDEGNPGGLFHGAFMVSS
ncbi:hypothetical protein B0H34DRAFT_474653 [Crassisporium funariophilum]|nr:hypothetical protein B0H34DRAFT_474653 [Crassisporium funariophilum]